MFKTAKASTDHTGWGRFSLLTQAEMKPEADPHPQEQTEHDLRESLGSLRWQGYAENRGNMELRCNWSADAEFLFTYLISEVSS